MTEGTRPQGKTTIAPDVLISIAKLSALSVPGVYQMAETPAVVSNLFKHRKQDGVQIVVEGDMVSVDLFLILNSDVQVLDVSKKVQNQVARAISEMVGLDAGKITVHVQDIHYS